MASIIPGFEYDIFISYRHKDNKYDGWVSKFVDNLKRELDATFKEQISVYFDSNRDDGLLETHNVGLSLTSKIKSLIFIPVLSQTYCDANSFAWQHEFITFNTITLNDDFGREVKLANGNVANRVLPVRIHELDPSDERMLFDIMNTQLRSIEFIYKLPGVNRPLEPEDDGRNNNPYFYRDQINKVANACKEIISGMKVARDGDTISSQQKTDVESAINTQQSAVSAPTDRQLSFRVKIIQQVEIFSLLSDKLLQEVSAQIKTYNLQEEETLFEKGEPGDAMYIIVDGRVKIHDGGHVFGFLAGGECFGEYTLIDEEERSASVTATEATALYRVDQKVFQNLIQTHSTFANSVLRVLIQRLRRLDNMQRELSTSYKKISQSSKEISQQKAEQEAEHQRHIHLANEASAIVKTLQEDVTSFEGQVKLDQLKALLLQFGTPHQ